MSDETPTQSESAWDQIDRLAAFIQRSVPGEPSRDEGAIDTAIRLLEPAVNDLRARHDAQFLELGTPALARLAIMLEAEKRLDVELVDGIGRRCSIGEHDSSTDAIHAVEAELELVGVRVSLAILEGAAAIGGAIRDALGKLPQAPR